MPSVPCPEGDDRTIFQTGDEHHLHLTLYVSGSCANSIRAIRNIKRFCEQHLEGRYRLVVVDIYQQPERASLAQIVATPTLIKDRPPPVRRFVGNLGAAEKVLIGLGLGRREE